MCLFWVVLVSVLKLSFWVVGICKLENSYFRKSKHQDLFLKGGFHSDHSRRKKEMDQKTMYSNSHRKNDISICLTFLTDFRTRNEEAENISHWTKILLVGTEFGLLKTIIHE